LHRQNGKAAHLAKKKGAEEMALYLLDHGYVTPQPPSIKSKLAAAAAERGEAVFVIKAGESRLLYRTIMRTAEGAPFFSFRYGKMGLRI
jgi:hypothetical protein